MEKNGYPDIYFDKSQQKRFHEAIKKGMIERDVTDLAMLICENIMIRCDRRIEEIRDYRIKNFKKGQKSENQKPTEPGEE